MSLASLLTLPLSVLDVFVSRMKNNTKIALFQLNKEVPCLEAICLPLSHHESKIYDQQEKEKIPYAFSLLSH
jgi:hypothetical protein